MASQSTTAAALRRLTGAGAGTSKRGLAAFVPGHYEKGFKEFGPGGRSSVSGITAALFGGTGFMGKYLQFEMGEFLGFVFGGWTGCDMCVCVHTRVDVCIESIIISTRLTRERSHIAAPACPINTGKVGYRVHLANRGDEQDVRPFKVAFDLGNVRFLVGLFGVLDVCVV